MRIEQHCEVAICRSISTSRSTSVLTYLLLKLPVQTVMNVHIFHFTGYSNKLVFKYKEEQQELTVI